MEIKRLGLIDYQEALELQLNFLDQRIKNEIDDTLLLLEHTPTITIGRSGRKENLLFSDKMLEQNNVKFYEVNRGGDITFHGPGQLVCYPIIDLKNQTKDVHKYLRDLEQIIIDLLHEFDIESRRIDGLTGVFVKRSKIASIGVGIRRWVTFHGIAVNINTDLSYFDMIIPCGLSNTPVTSIKSWKNLNEDIEIKDVQDILINKFNKQFAN